MWNLEANRGRETSSKGYMKETEQIGPNYLRNYALNNMASQKQQTEEPCVFLQKPKIRHLNTSVFSTCSLSRSRASQASIAAF
jgi:hypothetical protein